jgi:hypothetical protein
VLRVIVNIDIHLSHLALLLLAWKLRTRNIQCKVQNYSFDLVQQQFNRAFLTELVKPTFTAQIFNYARLL